jgi:hypothetical protein
LAPFMYYAMAVMPVVMSIDPLAAVPGLRRWWSVMQDDTVVGPVLRRIHSSFSAVNRREYGKRFQVSG